jgi:drug/metabolite transporter (DMT)-like permease
MIRLLTVLCFGLLMEAVGVVLLSKGIKEIGDMAQVDLGELLRLVGRGATNRNILLGVAFEAGFFGCLLFLMSHGDVSFIWPLTALSFVLTTLAAKLFLHEHVSGLRWCGVLLIILGAGVITYTEKVKGDAKKTAAAPVMP